MPKEEEFIIHKTCQTPNTCEFGGLCQRALVIEQEVGNLDKNFHDDTDDLRVAVNEATCKHPDTLKAISAAQSYLSKES